MMPSMPPGADAQPESSHASGPPAAPTDNPFLIRVTDARGATSVRRVHAPTAQEALDEAASLGWGHAELLSSDFHTFIPDYGGTAKSDSVVRPEDWIFFKNPSRLARELRWVWIMYRTFWWAPLGGAGALVWRRLAGKPISYADALPVLLILAPAILLLFTRSGASSLYDEVQRRYLAGDWPGVLTLVDKLERALRRQGSNDMADLVSAEWRGRALARLGRTAEAMAGADRLAQNPRIKPLAVLHVRNMIHGASKNHEGVLACATEAASLEPHNAMGWLGLVDVLALWLNRPAEARLALEQARARCIFPADEAWGLDYSEAMVLLAEGKHAAARALFEKCLPRVRAIRTPISRGLLAMLQAQLAIACGRTGDLEAAKAHFAAARPHLERIDAEPLLSRARQAAGA